MQHQSTRRTFKKRPLASLIALSLMVAGSAASNQAMAQAAPTGFCNSGVITDSVDVNSNLSTSADCTIQNEGDVIVEGANLTNTAPNTLTNDNLLISYGVEVNSQITNQGNLVNNDTLVLDSYFGSSKLDNQAGAILTNNGGLVGYAYETGTNTLTNSGTLTNNEFVGLYAYGGGTNTVVNTESGLIENNGGLIREAIGLGATNTLTNQGTLINSGNENPDEPFFAGSMLVNSAGYGGHSTLTNTETGVLVNEGLLINTTTNVDDFEGASPAEFLPQPPLETLVSRADLVNQGTLINFGAIGNGDIPVDGPFVDTSGESTITNQGQLNNYGQIGNAGVIYNEGTLDIKATGSIISVNAEGVPDFGDTLPVELEIQPDFIPELPISQGGKIIQTAGQLIVNGEILGGTVDIQGGSLSGSGDIFAEVTIGENAQVNPGNSPGTLMIADDLILDGTLNTEIVSNTLFDVLEVEGEVALSDTTHFNFLFDLTYDAQDGDTFNFLSASAFDFGIGAEQFDFDNTFNFSASGLASGFNWAVSYIDNSAFLDQHSFLSLSVYEIDTTTPPTTDVTSPTTITLFGLTLTMLGLGARRRKRYA